MLEYLCVTTAEFLWNDHGTLAPLDLSIWRPNVPPGYFALGDVATGGPILRPSRSLVRCVHESLVERAPHDPVLRWSTEGTSARRAVSIWTLSPADFPWRDSVTVLKAA